MVKYLLYNLHIYKLRSCKKYSFYYCTDFFMCLFVEKSVLKCTYIKGVNHYRIYNCSLLIHSIYYIF